MRAHHLMIALSFTFATTDVLSETTVFKSTDSAGRISYGDEPAKEAIDFELIEITPPSESGDAKLDKRLERMAATTKRLQEDRRARELQREQERSSDTPEQNTVVYYPAANPSYYRYPSSHRPKHTVGNHRHNKQNPLYSADINLGFRSSRSSASLRFGNRETGHHRQQYAPKSSRRSQALPYSPLLKQR